MSDCRDSIARDERKLAAFTPMLEALEHIMEVHDRQDALGDIPWWMDSESWFDFDIPRDALSLAREAK